MSEDRLFKRSKLWMTRNLHSQKEIIELSEAKQGLIVANGTVDYPAAGGLDEIDKIQYTISFVMREEIRGSQILLTFENLILNVPKSYIRSRLWPQKDYVGGYSVPIDQRADFEATRRGVLAIAARLEEYLKQK